MHKPSIKILYILYMYTYTFCDIICVEVINLGSKYTEAQKKASQKYMANSLDEIKLRVPKGEKEVIKAHAEKFDGGSVNAFIQRAIAETMARDKAKK